LCVAVIDQFVPDAADVLSDLVENHGVAGVRLMRNKGGALRDPRVFPLWERARDLAIPVCVAARLDELADARVPIERYPQVTVCLEHMWSQPMGDPPYSGFQPMWDMARYPNVRLKITPNNSHQSREGRGTPKDFFAALVERFGARRILWGSNYPAHWDKYGKLPERLALSQQDMAFLSEEDRRWIFGESALAVWPSLR
jgi:predicted TIM-barrel fold metal-dependent hydrolase